MKKIFKSQLGRNLKSYVDDMIVKSITVPNHIADLKECFENVMKHKLKLKPEKCTIEVESRKFLGFIISNCDIEANTEKIKTIQEMQPPRT